MPAVSERAAAHVCDLLADLDSLGALAGITRAAADPSPAVRQAAQSLHRWFHHCAERLRGPQPAARAAHSAVVRSAMAVTLPQLHNPYLHQPRPRLSKAPAEDDDASLLYAPPAPLSAQAEQEPDGLQPSSSSTSSSSSEWVALTRS